MASGLFESLATDVATDSNTRENLLVVLRKVGIYVDHDFGDVVFYNVTLNKHIYTFHCSFTGQVFPLFQVLAPNTQITLSCKSWSLDIPSILSS